MAHSSITDLLSFFGNFLDFCRSAHETLTERRRKRAEAKAWREADDAHAGVEKTKPYPFFTSGHRDSDKG